jgi:tetratricopeptide (TPR) repeat protein
MKQLIALSVICASAVTANAQQNLKQPDDSPSATITQTIGLTDIKVVYHRPAVKGRKVWGQLVPWNEVWRAGANENTTITFSTDVKVGGKPVKAGTYGVHMIPTQKEWTIILSHMAVAWGSYTYDQKEDALRVTVAPAASPLHEERLSYHFDNPTEASVTLALRWEKLAVPVKIEVDTPAIVMASMRAELRGQANFSWQGWNQAAQYWLRNGGDLDEAQKMADKSFAMEPTFGNMMTRAMILDKKGDTAGAAELRAKALAKASENEVNLYGYALLQQKKMDEAIAVFRKNVEAHPESWNVHDSLGEALAMKGDKAGAAASYDRAAQLVKDPAQKKRIERTLAGLRGK